MWDEEKPAKKAAYELGADLSRLSVEELEALLKSLEEERQRIEATISVKKSSRDAANSVFR